MTDAEIKLNKLYNLLEELQDQDRLDDAATIRWAIFQIEKANDDA